MMIHRMFCAVVGLATTITAAAISAEPTTSVENIEAQMQYCCTINCWFCVALTCNPREPECAFPWPVCCATDLRGMRDDGSKIAYNKAGKEIIWMDAEAYAESTKNAAHN